MDSETRRIYFRHRRDGFPAGYALECARAEAAADWDFIGDGFVIAKATIGNAEIVAYADPEPYDWGDIEPTDDERERLEVIGIGVRVAGEDRDMDSVWGVGYLSGDWEFEAIRSAVDFGFLDLAETEVSERAYWADRGVKTV